MASSLASSVGEKGPAFLRIADVGLTTALGDGDGTSITAFDECRLSS